MEKKFSVFHRAVRTYRPGCDFFEDSPYDHPLALPGAIETWEGGSGGFLNQLVISAAYESLQRIDPIRDLPSFSTIKKRALELRRQRLEADHHNNQIDSDLITLAEAEISELKRNIEEWQALAHGEESERRRIEKERDQMRSQVGWLRDRIHQLETLRARDRGGDIDQDIVIPESLDELKDWAERELPGLVTITGRAARAARDGGYRDISLGHVLIKGIHKPQAM